jgi:rfaE bifunctional protein nucleotidyltransferase chain/domain
MSLVLANGCFDVLHAGHLAHLKEARSMGGELWVALTLDEFVGKGPGRPINSWRDRAALLTELRCVDRVLPTRNAVEAILQVKPAVFVKGVDYVGGHRFTEDIASACLQVGARLCYTTARKQSATDIIRRSLETA